MEFTDKPNVHVPFQKLTANSREKVPNSPSNRVSLEGNISISTEAAEAAIVKITDQMATQIHYQNKTGVDLIQRFSDVHSHAMFRGAMIFSISKYLERYGQKDSCLKEADKILDYAKRLVDFELKLVKENNND